MRRQPHRPAHRFARPSLVFALPFLIPLVPVGDARAQTSEDAGNDHVILPVDATDHLEAYRSVRLHSVQTDESVTAPYLGIGCEPVSRELAAHLPAPQGVGLRVHFIDANGPAGAADLQENDVLVKLADQWLINAEQFATLVRLQTPGEPVTLHVIRAGEPMQVQATPSEQLSVPLAPGGFVDQSGTHNNSFGVQYGPASDVEMGFRGAGLHAGFAEFQPSDVQPYVRMFRLQSDQAGPTGNSNPMLVLRGEGSRAGFAQDFAAGMDDRPAIQRQAYLRFSDGRTVDIPLADLAPEGLDALGDDVNERVTQLLQEVQRLRGMSGDDREGDLTALVESLRARIAELDTEPSAE